MKLIQTPVTNYVPGKTVTGYDGDVKVGDTLTYEISYVIHMMNQLKSLFLIH